MHMSRVPSGRCRASESCAQPCYGWGKLEAQYGVAVKVLLATD